MTKIFHVTYREDGKWQVIEEGNEHATAVFDRQADAMQRGLEIARSERSEIMIHGKNGKVREHGTFYDEVGAACAGHA